MGVILYGVRSSNQSGFVILCGFHSPCKRTIKHVHVLVVTRCYLKIFINEKKLNISMSYIRIH